MNNLIIICVFGVVTVAIAGTVGHDRGCVYILGRCERECPEGTHGYAPEGGCGHKQPEATCDEPNPAFEESIICDYSACHCDPPTVRDRVNDKCVLLENCPKKEAEKEEKKE